MGKVVVTPAYFLWASLTSTLKPCRKMTKKKTKIVAIRFERFGDEWR
jgi:hypothetical protein